MAELLRCSENRKPNERMDGCGGEYECISGNSVRSREQG